VAKCQADASRVVRRRLPVDRETVFISSSTRSNAVGLAAREELRRVVRIGPDSPRKRGSQAGVSRVLNTHVDFGSVVDGKPSCRPLARAWSVTKSSRNRE
jgi:hypothetical protein